MLCNIKPVPFHESDKHIFAKIPGGVPPSGSAHDLSLSTVYFVFANGLLKFCYLVNPFLSQTSPGFYVSAVQVF